MELTMQVVSEWQKAAEKTRKANGNRVQLWYDADSGRFTIVELIGQDYVVNQSKGTFQIPTALNYWDFETKAEREADLLRRTEFVVEQINAYLSGYRHD